MLPRGGATGHWLISAIVYGGRVSVDVTVVGVGRPPPQYGQGRRQRTESTYRRHPIFAPASRPQKLCAATSHTATRRLKTVWSACHWLRYWQSPTTGQGYYLVDALHLGKPSPPVLRRQPKLPAAGGGSGPKGKTPTRFGQLYSSTYDDTTATL